MANPSPLKTEELLIYTVARLLHGLEHVAVGASSPIPGAGALLARELSDGQLRVSMLGSREYSPFTDGGRELFDCAAQGRIDAFFLSGVQIDGQANIIRIRLSLPSDSEGHSVQPGAQHPGAGAESRFHQCRRYFHEACLQTWWASASDDGSLPVRF